MLDKRAIRLCPDNTKEKTSVNDVSDKMDGQHEPEQ